MSDQIIIKKTEAEAKDLAGTIAQYLAMEKPSVEDQHKLRDFMRELATTIPEEKF